MANIRVYSAPQLGLSPSERASDAKAQEARTVGALYDRAASSTRQIGDSFGSAIRGVGEVVTDYVAGREISSGGKAYAEMQQSLAKAWDSTIEKADVNDPTVAQRFQTEVVEPALEQLQSGFFTERGQNFIRGRVQSLREHTFAKTAADMSTRAGIAVRQNLAESINAYSATVHADPSALPTVMESYRAQVEGLVGASPNLRGIEGAKLRAGAAQAGLEKIVGAAITSAIEKNPDAGLAMSKDPKYARYIGDDLAKYERQAKTVKREMRADISWAQHQQDRMAKKASDEARMDKTLKILEGDPSVTLKSLRDDPAMSPDDKRLTAMLLMREMKPATTAQVSKTTMNELFKRMTLDEGDPQKITDMREIDQAMAAGLLGKEDYRFLREELSRPRTGEGLRVDETMNRFLRDHRRMIEKPDKFGTAQPDDIRAASAFEWDVRTAVREALKRGGPQEAMKLFNPDAPEFMGGPKNMRLYTQSFQDRSLATARRLQESSIKDPPPVPNAKRDPQGNWRRPVFDPTTGKTVWRRVEDGSRTPRPGEATPLPRAPGAVPTGR